MVSWGGWSIPSRGDAARLIVLLVALIGVPLTDAMAKPEGGGVGGEVINGQRVKNGTYPFIAAIQDRNAKGGKPQSQHMCGGSLIAERFVLTAAHCTYDFSGEEPRPLKPSELGVIVGQTAYGADQGVRRDVVSIARHEEFAPPQIPYDVAVLQLDKPVRTIEPVALIDPAGPNLDRVGSLVTIAGWGSIAYNLPTDPPEYYRVFPRRMREALTRVVPTSTCEDAIPFPGTGHATVLCVLRDGVAACNGDSGGPLFVKGDDGYVQLGATSFGYPTCQPNKPQGFARLSHPSIAEFVRKAAGLPRN